ncbi:unnamed protein product [Vitrella brassicaformis CCMP3155]|uniref:lipoyl(octanoyl) transferase n=2 Tax=Vitrella brassicaformis TaxID=1169539 RepID=A0A0G4EFW5_VITBC|nr:unnamed protein product [Vitrella brassicaformis CCMP3155]|mmetsp:Transcript_23139/g.57212  ORF Transcript_23139/g.57212 Transcript_23139/m.57212 type:complete len:338 (+) Transcript_23139:127-1140(+)|eukprot:CEL94587.1 unnamed protein product [Vitrella brassicaformis CCMP3155]
MTHRATNESASRTCGGTRLPFAPLAALLCFLIVPRYATAFILGLCRERCIPPSLLNEPSPSSRIDSHAFRRMRRNPLRMNPAVAAAASSVREAPAALHGGLTEVRHCAFYDMWNETVPYEASWDLQHRLMDAMVDELAADGCTRRDMAILLQHPPVFTLGTASTEHNILATGNDTDDDPIPVFRTERGGEVTYHGPGQLVLYPIVDLRHHKQDLHWYLRSLEEVIIRTLERLGVEGERIEGLTGVWVEGRKVAAIGVRVRKWVTMHGVALNVDPNMAHFERIVPCGISDRPVGSVRECVRDGVTTERVAGLLMDSFAEVFGVQLEREEGGLAIARQR